MANHINPRRVAQCRDSRGVTCKTNYCKSIRGSCKFEKGEWNGRVRKDGRRLCEEFMNIHATQAGVYSRWACPVELVYNLRPWMD